MTEQEIKVSFINLKNNINELKNISNTLGGIKSYTDCFFESEGLSKEALSRQLDTTINAGLMLQKAIDDLVIDLECAAETFREMDDTLSNQFKYCGRGSE